MDVTLIGDDTHTYSETVAVHSTFTFSAQVENLSFVPMRVVASLATPPDWSLSAGPTSNCPTDYTLGHKDICTITWKFYPQDTGQVFLRVYVRGYYLDSAGVVQRITSSPDFIVTVVG